jgi:GMP synthase (glutamine-hydrolysing)
MQNSSRVAILDAGGQYVDLVQKAVERQGFVADVLDIETPEPELAARFGAVIMSGSPSSSHTSEAPKPDEQLWNTRLPFLGICYGQQALAQAFGGEVKTGAIREDGRVTTTVDTTEPIFRGVKKELTGLFTHGDFVTTVPKGFRAIGKHALSDGEVVYSAIAKDNFTGVQFHPEVFDDTPEGYVVFSNFLKDVAGLRPDETLIEHRNEVLIETLAQQIQDQADGKHVIAFASGGIDSTVATLLATKAIEKEKLHIYYIDNGFMRDEDDAVIEMLQGVGVPVVKVEATEEFQRAIMTNNAGEPIGPLAQVTDPEEKRKIIGQKFVDIKDRLVHELQLDASETLLLQGTNAADRIESGHSKGGKATDTIKTHHNQVAAIKELEANGLLIEPLDQLFKDEIRQLGHSLGLPDEVVWRQPFPGPGLAIRILTACEGALPKSATHEAAEAFASKHGYNALVLPVRSVGVGGDARSHLAAVALAGPRDWKTITDLAHDFPAHFRGEINRVVYRLDSEELPAPTSTKTDLTNESTGQLRTADRIVFEEMRRAGLLKKINQFPVVLLPLTFNKPGERTIVLRPVITNTFMTVQAAMPGRDLPEAFTARVTERIMQEVSGISAVFLDATNKPPGTTEWE